MKKLIFLFYLFFLNGCGTMITVPIDSTPLSKDKPTLIIYHEQGLAYEFKVSIDRKPVGKVTSENPLKIAVEPGKHDVFIEVDEYNGIITETFNKSQTYYMKTWLDFSNIKFISIKIEPTDKIDTYKVKSFK